MQASKTVLEELEELEDIRLYDAAKADSDEPSVPIEEAFAMIEAKRRSTIN